jgi:type II restriction/modification system DNA methylase subunit YeeA
VLDPACGSGNFLYVALRALKDLENRFMIEAEALGLQREFPQIGLASVKGLEINAYAAELARVTVWIGEIQWMRRNGFDVSRNPILKPLDNVECQDALLNPDGTEAEWPEADVIVGNPPFLGGKWFLSRLGNEYVARLRAAYHGRVPSPADLVVYWFEKAAVKLQRGGTRRVGLVATNMIRGAANRPVLQRIVSNGHIFFARSDDEWTVEGADVRVSIVCFGSGVGQATLDGREVQGIGADLKPTAFSDLQPRVRTHNQ